MWPTFTNARTALRALRCRSPKGSKPTSTSPAPSVEATAAETVSSTGYVSLADPNGNELKPTSWENAARDIYCYLNPNWRRQLRTIPVSTQVCGCDPEAKWKCERHRAELAEKMVSLMEPREERIEKLYTQETERPTNPVATPWSSVKQPLANAKPTLPKDAAERKTYPIYSGVLAYFPDALAEVAHVSWVGNQQHNPGQPLHWAREKSTDEKDAEVRHLVEPLTLGGSKFDSDGVRHSAKKAWRALADLQKEIEEDRRNGR